MPRNGSGTYSVPTTFVANTPALAADVNTNFTDVATALTASLAIDGQSAMTGQLKVTDGTINAPGIGFGSDTNTGFYRSASGVIRATCDGTNSFTMTASGAAVTGTLTASGTITGAWAYLPATTAALFKQTAAPTGWTKDTSNNNNSALRVVTGTASTGGTVDFTTAFASQAVSGTVGGTAISIAQMPLHGHPFRLSASGVGTSGGSGGLLVATSTSRTNYTSHTGTPGDSAGDQIGGEGGGATHDHSFTGTAINLAVKYTDVIVATKDA